MAFAQIGASPLNGKTTYFKREGLLYKTVATTTHNSGALPAVRVTDQSEIDAFNADPNAFEHYKISVEQQAELLGKGGTVVYPAIPKPDDIAITGGAAAGVDIAINGEAKTKTIVLRVAIIGKSNGAEMLVSADGNFHLTKVNNVAIAEDDVLSITFAYFNGTYSTVDAALASLEAWQWCEPYVGHKVTA